MTSCLISPLLGTIYVDAIMREALQGIDNKIKVGRKFRQVVALVDDQGMTAKTKDRL